MTNDPRDTGLVDGRSRQAGGARLLHAAALAAALVPLAAITADAATITCYSSTVPSGGCNALGNYAPAPTGPTSNTWEFYDALGNIIYTFTISGDPTSTFQLDVIDVVTTQAGLAGDLSNNFPDHVCVPTFDEGQCGLFDVFIFSGTPTWTDGYTAEIVWFSNGDPLSNPPNDGRNTILHALDPPLGDGTTFNEMLTDIQYYPFLGPPQIDPGISGRGNSFSRFGVFRNVPEPGGLLLLGMSALAAFVRFRARP